MWECESIYNYLAERGKAERRDRTAAGQTGSSQCASEPLTAHITDRQSELQLLDWTESEEDQETSPASVWQRRRGEQRTPPSSGRSVYSTVAAILLYSILPDIMLSWATVLLELTSFTAWLSSLLTINCGGYKCFHFALTKHGVSRTNDCLVAG